MGETLKGRETGAAWLTRGLEPVLESPWRVLVVDPDPRASRAHEVPTPGWRGHGRAPKVVRVDDFDQARTVLLAEGEPAVVSVTCRQGARACVAFVERLRRDLGYMDTRVIVRVDEPAAGRDDEGVDGALISELDVSDWRHANEVSADLLIAILNASLRSFGDRALARGVERRRAAVARVLATISIEGVPDPERLGEVTAQLIGVGSPGEFMVATRLAGFWSPLVINGRRVMANETVTGMISPASLTMIQAAAAAGRVMAGTDRVVMPLLVDGSLNWAVEVSTARGLDPLMVEQLNRFAETLRAVSRSRRLETALRVERRRRDSRDERLADLTLAVETAPNPVMRVSARGDVLFANTPANWLVERLLVAGAAQSMDWMRPIIARVNDVETTRLDISCPGGDFEVSVTPIVGTGTAFVHFLAPTATDTVARGGERQMARPRKGVGPLGRRDFLRAMRGCCQRLGTDWPSLALVLIRLGPPTEGAGVARDRQVEWERTMSRLRGVVRANDLMGWISDNEFAVVAPLDQTALEAGVALADRLVQAITTRCEEGGGSTIVVDGHGVAIAPSDGVGVKPLMAAAWARMDGLEAADSQPSGRGPISRQTSPRSSPLIPQNTPLTPRGPNHGVTPRCALWDADRGETIDLDIVDFDYQPLVCLEDCAAKGAEALARYDHPDHGRLPPSVFIPPMERSGHIGALGRWAIDKACARVAEWRSGRFGGSFVSVNIAPPQLMESDFVNHVREALNRHDLPPSALTLEFTETMAFEDMAAAAKVMRELRDLGVGLSIDDFGTGHASFTHLRRLPVTELKIDRGFIAGLVDEPSDRAITRAVITLGRELGLNVVAEGVENTAQLAILRDLGCPMGQGFLFGKPGDAAAFDDLVAWRSEPRH